MEGVDQSFFNRSILTNARTHAKLRVIAMGDFSLSLVIDFDNQDRSIPSGMIQFRIVIILDLINIMTTYMTFS